VIAVGLAYQLVGRLKIQDAQKPPRQVPRNDTVGAVSFSQSLSGAGFEEPQGGGDELEKQQQVGHQP